MKHRRFSETLPGPSPATSRWTRPQERRANFGSIRAMETTAGPVIGRSIRHGAVRARGRGGPYPGGGRPAGRGGLGSPSNAEYHAATPGASPWGARSSWSPLRRQRRGWCRRAGRLPSGRLSRSLGRAFGRCCRDPGPRDGLPEFLADSRTAQLLEGVCDVDLEELDIELPRRFGRDCGPDALRDHRGSRLPSMSKRLIGSRLAFILGTLGILSGFTDIGSGRTAGQHRPAGRPHHGPGGGGIQLA